MFQPSIVGVGSTTGCKIRTYWEGGLNIMGATRIYGTVDNKKCLDIVAIVDVKSYMRNDIGDDKKMGLIAQELTADISATLPDIKQRVVQSGDIQQ